MVSSSPRRSTASCASIRVLQDAGDVAARGRSPRPERETSQCTAKGISSSTTKRNRAEAVQRPDSTQ
jgi:hypothetical protein